MYYFAAVDRVAAVVVVDGGVAFALRLRNHSELFVVIVVAVAAAKLLFL